MKVITTGPVKHDGEDIEIGTTLDLSVRQAESLIDSGAAKLPEKKPKPDDSGKGEQ
jgi:hypothetical protein